MQKVMIIARHEYWVNVRRPDFIIVTLLVPLLGLAALLVSAFFGGQAGSALEGALDSERQLSALVDQSGRFTSILPQYQAEYGSGHKVNDEKRIVRTVILVIR